jgi:uncharacterized membrane protein YhaH (DUF805 family)
MSKLRRLFSVLPVFFVSQMLWAQSGSDDAAGAAGCLACGGFMIFFAIALLAVNIAILVWVARDAKNRGMDNAVLWMVLVFFTGLIGLVIYIFARPQGNLVQCASCQNKRLQVSAKCPHCGNA